MLQCLLGRADVSLAHTRLAGAAHTPCAVSTLFAPALGRAGAHQRATGHTLPRLTEACTDLASHPSRRAFLPWTNATSPPDTRHCLAMQRLSTTLGFPRLGPRREVKLALESFWAGKTSEAELLATVHACEAVALSAQRDAGAHAARAASACHIALALRLRAANKARRGTRAECPSLHRRRCRARGPRHNVVRPDAGHDARAGPRAAALRGRGRRRAGALLRYGAQRPWHRRARHVKMARRCNVHNAA